MAVREMEDRYLTSHKLFGVPEEVLRARLAGELPLDCSGYECFPDKDSNLNDSFWNLYGNYFASRYGNFRNFIAKAPQDAVKEKRLEKIEELVDRYRDLEVDWAAVAGAYVYYGPLEKQIASADFSKNRNLSLVYGNESVEVYKVIR